MPYSCPFARHNKVKGDWTMCIIPPPGKENVKYLPGITLPEHVKAEPDLKKEPPEGAELAWPQTLSTLTMIRTCPFCGMVHIYVYITIWNLP